MSSKFQQICYCTELANSLTQSSLEQFNFLLSGIHVIQIKQFVLGAEKLRTSCYQELLVNELPMDCLVKTQVCFLFLVTLMNNVIAFSIFCNNVSRYKTTTTIVTIQKVIHVSRVFS